jgi:hypothetical protein
MRLLLGDGRRERRARRSLATAIALGSAALACAWAVGCGGDAFTAASDAGTPEASVPVPDAGMDGGSIRDAGMEAGGPTWCATHGTGHTFCEDFARGVPDQLVELVVNGAIAEGDAKDALAPSQPTMLTSLLALAPKGGQGSALGQVSFAKTASNHVVASTYFNVLSSCFATTGSMSPISILALDYPEQDYELVVTVLPSSIALVEITTDTDGGNPKTQQQQVQATGLLDGWQHWQLTVEESAPKAATLMVGNATLFDKVTLKSAPLIAPLQHPSILVGVTGRNDGSEPTPACAVGVDDILVDVTTVAVATPAH